MSRSKDIKFLENYLDWKSEKTLVPPTWSPEEYAEHLEQAENAKRIEAAIAMIDKYNMGVDWEPAMVDSLKKILEGTND